MKNYLAPAYVNLANISNSSYAPNSPLNNQGLKTRLSSTKITANLLQQIKETVASEGKQGRLTSSTINNLISNIDDSFSFIEESKKVEISISEDEGKNILTLRETDINNGREASNFVLCHENLNNCDNTIHEFNEFLKKSGKETFSQNLDFKEKPLTLLVFTKNVIYTSDRDSEAKGNIVNIVQYENKFYFSILSNKFDKLFSNIPGEIDEYINQYQSNEDITITSTAMNKQTPVASECESKKTMTEECESKKTITEKQTSSSNSELTAKLDDQSNKKENFNNMTDEEIILNTFLPIIGVFLLCATVATVCKNCASEQLQENEEIGTNGYSFLQRQEDESRGLGFSPRPYNTASSLSLRGRSGNSIEMV